MARNELTSKRVAAIAGRTLLMISDCNAHPSDILCLTECCVAGPEICTIADLKALAASALTQTADKPKRKRTKNVKKRSK